MSTQDNDFKMTDLQLAVMTDNIEALKALDQGHGASVRAKINDKVGGFTMLHVASMRTGDSEALVRQLLQMGAQPDERNPSGVTALCFLCNRLQIGAARVLVEAGADVNAADTNGFTPLMYAISRSGESTPEQEAVRHALIRLLVEHGASVQQKDRLKRLAIHHAAKHNDEATYLLLRDLGCDMHAPDKDGKLPLDLGEPKWARKVSSKLMADNIMGAMSDDDAGAAAPKSSGFTL